MEILMSTSKKIQNSGGPNIQACYVYHLRKIFAYSFYVSLKRCKIAQLKSIRMLFLNSYVQSRSNSNRNFRVICLESSQHILRIKICENRNRLYYTLYITLNMYYTPKYENVFKL